MEQKIDLNKVEAYTTLPTVKSTDAAWMHWADLVEKKYGANLGKQIFVAAWKKNGSQAANTYALRSHVKDNYNIDISETAWDKIGDLGGGVADSLGKVFKVGKVLMVVGAGVVLIALGAAVYNTVKR